jgi:hypothetical protein
VLTAAEDLGWRPAAILTHCSSGVSVSTLNAEMVGASV